MTRKPTPKRRVPTPTPTPMPTDMPTAYQALLEHVKTQFRQAGISVSGWARANGFSRNAVVDVLRGHRIGNYGEAHRVAVALGLKEGAVVDVKLFKPAALPAPLPADLPAAQPTQRQRVAA